MKRILKRTGLAAALLVWLAGSWCAGTVYAQARASTTGGVVTIRQVISGTLSMVNNSVLSIVQGTITADAQAISTSATWNNAGVTFTGWKENVTNTNSASGSKLMDLQAGGFSKFWVDTNGHIDLGNSVQLNPQADGVLQLGNNTNGDFTRLQFGGTTNGFPALKRSTTGFAVRLADDSADSALLASHLAASGASVTVGSGTGVTVNDANTLVTQVYKVTIDKSAFICAATTCDVTIATLPAKTFVSHALADLTTTFACTATCTTATLSATLGKTAGGNQYLLSFDADAATAQFGDAAAELGASLAPATVPTLVGDVASWTTTTAVVMRLTSGTGNIGNASVSNLSQGSVTFYLTTTRFP